MRSKQKLQVAVDHQHLELAELLVFEEVAGRQGGLQVEAAVGAVDVEVHPAQARQRGLPGVRPHLLVEQRVDRIGDLLEGHEEEGGPLAVEGQQAALDLPAVAPLVAAGSTSGPG